MKISLVENFNKKLLLILFLLAPSFVIAKPLNVVASFSIIANWVEEIGGDKVKVETLITAEADAHVFQPTPTHAKKLARADIVFSNGLGFEGWLNRLIKTSNFKGIHVISSKGVNLIYTQNHHEHSNSDEHKDKHDDEHSGHDEHEEEQDNVDPHAWQNVANALIYVKNIAKVLCQVDENNCEFYKNNAKSYSKQLQQLDKQIKLMWKSVPINNRKILTSHLAFNYYGAAYGVEFFAPIGMNHQQEASAKAISLLIRKIKKENIKALFIENISNRKLIDKIASETNTIVSGKLYAGTLAHKKGDNNANIADSYIGMMKLNTNKMVNAILK